MSYKYSISFLFSKLRTRSHLYRRPTVVVKNWLTIPNYSSGSVAFYMDVFCPVSLTRQFTRLDYMSHGECNITKQELRTIRERLGLPPVYVGCVWDSCCSFCVSWFCILLPGSLNCLFYITL